MENNPNDIYIIGGLVVNVIVTMLAVMNSKLKLENRLTKVETLISVLIDKSGAHVRSGDLCDTDRNQ